MTRRRLNWSGHGLRDTRGPSVLRFPVEAVSRFAGTLGRAGRAGGSRASAWDYDPRAPRGAPRASCPRLRAGRLAGNRRAREGPARPRRGVARRRAHAVRDARAPLHAALKRVLFLARRVALDRRRENRMHRRCRRLASLVARPALGASPLDEVRAVGGDRSREAPSQGARERHLAHRRR